MDAVSLRPTTGAAPPASPCAWRRDSRPRTRVIVPATVGPERQRDDSARTSRRTSRSRRIRLRPGEGSSTSPPSRRRSTGECARSTSRSPSYLGVIETQAAASASSRTRRRPRTSVGVDPISLGRDRTAGELRRRPRLRRPAAARGADALRRRARRLRGLPRRGPAAARVPDLPDRPHGHRGAGRARLRPRGLGSHVVHAARGGQGLRRHDDCALEHRGGRLPVAAGPARDCGRSARASCSARSTRPAAWRRSTASPCRPRRRRASRSSPSDYGHVERVREVNAPPARAASSAATTSPAIPELRRTALVCVTEIHTQADLDRLVEAAAEAVAVSARPISTRPAGTSRSCSSSASPASAALVPPPVEDELAARVGPALGARPASTRRERPPALPEVAQPRLRKHFLRLSQETMGAAVGVDIGQGTATMKYARPSSTAAPGRIAGLHPLQADETVRGLLEVVLRFERILCALSGSTASASSPAAARTASTPTPASSAPTTPTAASRARDEIVTTLHSHPSDAAAPATRGLPDRHARARADRLLRRRTTLRRRWSERTAGLIVANPEDTGLFNPAIDRPGRDRARRRRPLRLRPGQRQRHARRSRAPPTPASTCASSTCTRPSGRRTAAAGWPCGAIGVRAALARLSADADRRARREGRPLRARLRPAATRSAACAPSTARSTPSCAPTPGSWPRRGRACATWRRRPSSTTTTSRRCSRTCPASTCRSPTARAAGASSRSATRSAAPRGRDRGRHRGGHRRTADHRRRRRTSRATIRGPCASR